MNVQQDRELEHLEPPDKLRIRTLVVDSDPIAAVGLQEILRQDPDIDILGSCANGQEALSAIRAHKPDLIFLDARMPGLDGFSLLDQLRGGPMPAVIFVSTHDDLALKAFEVSALDYLIKPAGPERVRKAVHKAKAFIRPNEKPAAGAILQRLAIRTGKKVFFLKPDEIDWIDAEGNCVRIHSGAESYVLKLSMSMLESQLDQARFVRIHRSTIVNLERIRWLEPANHGNYRLVLHDGTQLVMRRKGRFAGLTSKASRG